MVMLRRLLYWYGDAWKEHLSFMFIIGLIVVRNILRVVHRHSGDKCLVVHRHSGDECFPQWFSLGGVLEGYSDCTPGGIRGNGEERDVI